MYTYFHVIVFIVSLFGMHDRLIADSNARVGFTDAAKKSGLDFVHENGMESQLWLAEILGAGVAVVDFDHDGLLDIWLIQGGPLRSRSGALPNDQLYKNVSTPEDLRFKNVTAEAGIVTQEYGMGIATGDIDNDGDLDVFLANFGPNQLFENLGVCRTDTYQSRLECFRVSHARIQNGNE